MSPLLHHCSRGVLEIGKPRLYPTVPRHSVYIQHFNNTASQHHYFAAFQEHSIRASEHHIITKRHIERREEQLSLDRLRQ